MRGKDAFYGTAIENLGITPAYAGKSRSVRRSGILTQDHPRLCGEKQFSAEQTTITVGSPPPMRGKGFQSGEGQFLIGITPAYAGKSSAITLQLLIVGDHPRLCGEKEERYCQGCDVIGSPPPMRGKVCKVCLGQIFKGITPAYAGKSGGVKKPWRLNEDHPRLCGEKDCGLLCIKSVMGSPPPMRGKVPDSCRHGVLLQDHPRLCGEKSK